MCEKCNALEQKLEEENAKPRITKTNWWAGVLVTIIIFILTQVYVSGKIVGQIETHVKDLTIHHDNKDIQDEYLSEKEFIPYAKQLERIENKLDKLLEKK